MFDEQLPVGLAFLPLLLGLGPLGMESERMKKYIYLKEKSIHIKLQQEFNQVRSGQWPDSSGNRLFACHSMKATLEGPYFSYS
jgi:hypothetical protein